MAEAMELDLAINKTKNNPIKNPVPSTPSVPEKDSQKENITRFSTENIMQ